MSNVSWPSTAFELCRHFAFPTQWAVQNVYHYRSEICSAVDCMCSAAKLTVLKPSQILTFFCVQRRTLEFFFHFFVYTVYELGRQGLMRKTVPRWFDAHYRAVVNAANAFTPLIRFVVDLLCICCTTCHLLYSKFSTNPHQGNLRWQTPPASWCATYDEYLDKIWL